MKFTELPRPLKTLILFSMDGVLAVCAYWIATIARFGRVPSLSLEHVLTGTALAAILMPTVALALGFYRSVTRFQTPGLASHAGMVSGLCGAILATIALHGGVRPLQAGGFGLVFALVFFTLLLFSRGVARWMLRRPSARSKRVAIYGAGDAGRQLAALLTRGDHQRPVVFIDDDPKLRGRSIEGLPVISPTGGRFAERLRAHNVREVLIAIPSLKPGRRRQRPVQPAFSGGSLRSTEGGKQREKNNDQIDSCCCLYLSHRNLGACNNARAASSAGRHDHASPPCMRYRLSHGQWHLHSYCRSPECRQVCGRNAYSGWPLR